MLELEEANAKLQQQDAQICKLVSLLELLGFGAAGRGGSGGVSQKQQQQPPPSASTQVPKEAEVDSASRSSQE